MVLYGGVVAGLRPACEAVQVELAPPGPSRIVRKRMLVLRWLSGLS